MDKNIGFGETPPRLKKRIRQGPAKGTKLDFSLKEGRDFKRLKPIEEGDMGAPSLATDEDYKKVARDMRSPVQSELAEIGKGRELIKKVENMPGITSESDNRMQDMIVEQKPSENSGGFLEMFGLAGGRRRRRRKSRRKKRRRKRENRIQNGGKTRDKRENRRQNGGKTRQKKEKRKNGNQL